MRTSDKLRFLGRHDLLLCYSLKPAALRIYRFSEFPFKIKDIALYVNFLGVNMAIISYWTISIIVYEVKSSLMTQQARDEMYLSANVKLSGINGMACIESEALANDFLNGCRSALDKRYKSGYEAKVQESGGSNCKSLVKQIEIDSAVIRERLRTCNFSSNRKVEIV